MESVEEAMEEHFDLHLLLICVWYEILLLYYEPDHTSGHVYEQIVGQIVLLVLPTKALMVSVVLLPMSVLLVLQLTIVLVVVTIVLVSVEYRRLDLVYD